MEEPTGIRIPPGELAQATLHNLVEEMVTRDGTELTDADIKVSEVLEALDRGDVEIWFDPATKSCSLNRVR